MTATRNRYTSTAVILHWLMAAAILFQLALGWRMVDLPKGPAVFALFQLHKSIGFTVLMLVVLRLAWRVGHRPPPLPDTMPDWERRMAKLAHVALYLVMFGLPLTGWMLVSTSRTPVPTLLFGQIPWPNVPFLSGLPADTRGLWHEGAELIHGGLAVLLLALLAMHVGAVLKHQLLVKDAVLGHMAPGARPGWGEPRLWLLLLGAGGVFAAGFFLPKLPEVPGGMSGRPEQVVVAPALPVATAPVSVEVPSVGTATKPVVEPASPSDKPATPATPVVWKVKSGSALHFSTSWSGAAVAGSFPKWTADIRFSPEALAESSVTVRVDVTAISTEDPQQEAALPGEDWFNAEQFPKAVFKASGFEQTGKDRYRAKGTLTLRGTSAPVVLDFRLTMTGNTAMAEGSTMLDRTVFGVGQGEFAATDQIPSGVKVMFAVKAARS